MLAFLRASMPRTTDVACNRSIVCNPPSARRLEAESRRDILKAIDIAHQFGMNRLDHRGLPFTGMPHVTLYQIIAREPWFCMVPISREKQQQVLSRAIPLPSLEHRLPSGDIVATVSVQEYDPTKTVPNRVVDHPVEQINISPRFGGERSRKMEVMIRISQPLQRCK